MTYKNMSYKKINGKQMSGKHVTEFDHIFRVLFVGDDSVGKTSLLQRYVENTFSDIYIPTIGIDFKINTVKLDKKVTLTSSRSKVIKLQLYDTGGGDYFRTIVSAYYPNTDAIVIVYDISDIDSFRHVEIWLRDALQSKKDQNVPKFLIGNKTDLPSYRRAVTYVAGETLARQHGMIFFETSAKIKGDYKTQSNILFPQRSTTFCEGSVEDIFIEICKECLLYKTPSERGPLLASFDSTEKKNTETKRYCFCC